LTGLAPLNSLKHISRSTKLIQFHLLSRSHLFWNGFSSRSVHLRETI